jgi:ABC-2 type transport system permease protein
MKKWIDKIFASKLWWLPLLVVLFGINYLASVFHARLDLTKEKRYTLSKATKDLLKNLDEEVQIDVFLKGEFPSKFRKLTNSVGDFLKLLKESNSSKLSYTFISPEDEFPGVKGMKYADTLERMGAFPINLKAQVKTGESSSLAYPFAVMNYKGKQELITLFTVPSVSFSNSESPEKVINSAEALLEYQFVKTLDGLISTEKPHVAYSVGNGEPSDARTYGIQDALSKNYQLGIFDLNKHTKISTDVNDPGKIDIFISVKPSLQFTEEEKLKLDQFVMRGGKVILFIDNLIAEQDSLRFKAETIAYDRNLNLTDQLFKYGVRINTDLVMSLDCDYMPFGIGGNAENPQYEFLKWNYYPLFGSSSNNPITKNSGLVIGRFVNSIDTIATPGVKKTILLSSSPNSRIISTPALISLNENKNEPEDAKFKKSDIPVAILLEGKFTSIFRNRISKSQIDSLNASGSPFVDINKDVNKMIVVADGDMVLNDVSPQKGPLSLGTNLYTTGSQYDRQFANKDFLLNCLEYLVNKPGIIEARNKDIVLRLLDSQKVKEQKTTWQLINIALPVLIVILFGFAYQQIRKRKYAA